MIYPEYLSHLINRRRDLENYVPRLMSKDDDLRLFHKYVSMSDIYDRDPFKVESTFVEDGTVYYCIKNLVTSRFAVIPAPVDNIDYEFIRDRNDLKHAKIINSENYYYGSEIKYWFYIHKIDLDSDKYRVFRKYIEANEDNTIIDNNVYQVSGIFVNGIYTSCQFTKIQRKSR